MKSVKPLMNKSFIAKLLVLCMIVGLLPTIALAATGANGKTYTLALDAAPVNGSVYYSVNDDAVKALSTTAYAVDADADVTVTLKADANYVVGTGSTYTIGEDTYNFTTGSATATATFKMTDDVVVKSVFTAASGTNPGTNPGTTGGTTTTADTVKDVVAPAEGSSEAVVNANATISGSTATASVNDTHMSDAVEEALAAAEKNGTAPVVNITVDTKDATALNLTLGTAAFDELAANPDAVLKITSGAANLEFDADAIKAMADQSAGSIVISVAPYTDLTEDQAKVVGESVVYEVKVTANGKAITDFGTGTITIGLPYEPAEDEVAADVQVFYLDGDELFGRETEYDADEKIVSFTTDHLSLYVIGNKSMSTTIGGFSDVSSDRWFAESVKYVSDNGLMIGFPDGTFGPNVTTTRAMVVTTLYRLAEKPEVDGEVEYSDVEDGKWYTDAVVWATEQGVVNGYTDGTFDPDKAITREEMATMLHRYAKNVLGLEATETTDLDAYEDAGTVGSWALDAVKWANAVGLMKGTETTVLSPKTDLSRAQLATFLMRFDKNIVK